VHENKKIRKEEGDEIKEENESMAIFHHVLPARHGRVKGGQGKTGTLSRIRTPDSHQAWLRHLVGSIQVV
jgi:hypothetical protein